MDKHYYGNYVGVVIQNNDPDHCGKVKVFIPHLSPTVYSGWINEDENRVISELIGGNIGDDLNSILEDLKIKLPWADCAAPLVGESSTGRYNNFNNAGSISDSNFLSTTFTNGASSLSADGNAPSSLFTNNSAGLLTDAFVSAADNINRPNPLAYNYRPNEYSNAARGAFAIPAVGSHVWVFFREGNPQFPVYFAASFGQKDWTGIYGLSGSIDYPDSYENRGRDAAEADHNIATYRNKYVINQKGGSLEFINTDLNEKVKLSHYSGSYTEMANEATIEVASSNKNTLVLNDVYSTTRGFKNEYTGKNLDEIVYRDKYKKVGSLNETKFLEWKKIAAPIQEYKQLFEIKRSFDNSIKNNNGVTVLKRNSILQERKGDFANNPVMDGTLTYTSLTGPVNTITNVMNGGGAWNSENVSTITGSYNATTGLFPNNNEQPALSPSTQDGTWEIDTRKDTLKDLIETNLPKLTKIEQDLGIGGSEIIQITKNKVETIGMMMNNFGNYRLDPEGKLVSSEVLPTPTATGKSSLVYVNKEAAPMIEYVHVQDLPGGSSTLNVSNRYNVLVGAGGLNLKSYGPTNITGSITNVTGEQVNIGSANEINVDAKVINITADILSLRNKRQKQVLADGNLGVTNNVVIGGALLVDGETYLQHVTAPREFQITEVASADLTGAISVNLAGFNSSYNSGNPGNGTLTFLAPTQRNVVEHSHVFANLPLTLKDQPQDVRGEAADNNISSNPNPIPSEGIANGKK